MTDSKMSEDQVIDAMVAHYTAQGWMLLYRTTRCKDAGGPGEQGGADAIFKRPDAMRFLFLEAKGDGANNAKLSTNFNNVLGAAIKRICIGSGYCSNEPLAGFDGGTRRERDATRDLIATHGKLCNSRYVIALTPAYKQRANSLDVQVQKLLNLTFAFVNAQGQVEEQPEHV